MQTHTQRERLQGVRGKVRMAQQKLVPEIVRNIAHFMIEKSKDIHDTQDMTQHTRQACTPHKTQRTTHNAHSTQNTAHRTQHTTYYTQQTMHKHHNIQHKKQHTTQIKLGKHTYKAGTR
jgi:hypothetical protein